MLSTAISAVIAIAIIGIGLFYIVNPRVITPSFGLPLPDTGPNTAWWLRLKGVRDLTMGLLVIASLVWGSAHETGALLLIAATIPTGDMLTILAARGSVAKALGVHGLTAAVMIMTGIAVLMAGVH
jgi:hypothetical protein